MNNVKRRNQIDLIQLPYILHWAVVNFPAPNDEIDGTEYDHTAPNNYGVIEVRSIRIWE